MRQHRAAQVELAIHGAAKPMFQMLRDDLAEDDLFSEILRSDAQRPFAARAALRAASRRERSALDPAEYWRALSWSTARAVWCAALAVMVGTPLVVASMILLPVIMSAKFSQVQKHLSLTGHVYSPCIFVMNKAAFDKLGAADKQAFLDAAKEAIKANRARVDEDDAKGVADLRAKGMTVIDNVDKARFVAALAPVNAEFEKQFGKANLDKIRDVK
jgi:hypothetical protein